MEFIAGIKLIENKMGCRRVSVPNDDDTGGKRILNIVGVSHTMSYIMPPAHQKHICHICYIYNIYGWITVFRLQHTIWSWVCSVFAFRKKIVNNLGWDEEWQSYQNNLWLWIFFKLLVVEYWKTFISEDEFYLKKKYVRTQNI